MMVKEIPIDSRYKCRFYIAEGGKCCFGMERCIGIKSCQKRFPLLHTNDAQNG